MDVARLRQETEADHLRAEQSMPLMEAGLDVPAYVGVLRRMYGFVAGWEQWTERVADAEALKLLRERRRAPLLRTDLEHFKAEVPSALYPGPKFSPAATARVYGAMYVMEGSTLGGQFIAKHVEEALALTPGSGDAYFRGHGGKTGQMWREVKGALNQLPESMTEEVIGAAKLLFRDFTVWNETPLSHGHAETTLA